MMSTTFQGDKVFCCDCSIALKRFIERVNGAAAVELGRQAMTIKFDDVEIKEDTVHAIARNSMESLGYRLIE